MPLDKGDLLCMSGLAKAIYDERVSLGSVIGHGDGAAAEAALRADCYALASAIVDYLVANTEVVISPLTGGLQTSTAPGSPTGPPTPLEMTLPIR